MVGFPCSTGCPYTQAHMGSTNWTRWVSKKVNEKDSYWVINVSISMGLNSSLEVISDYLSQHWDARLVHIIFPCELKFKQILTFAAEAQHPLSQLTRLLDLTLCSYTSAQSSMASQHIFIDLSSSLKIYIQSSISRQ